jgi:hypothetical protein
MHKTVDTLADLLAADLRRLMRRHLPAIAWLELAQPVIDRNRGREEKARWFGRHESVPHIHPQPRAARPVEAGAEDAEFEGKPVPPVARERLRELIGPEVHEARIHVNEPADALARAAHARAVTVGKDIYFRSDAFVPDTPAGLGLLAHELTHVAESERPGAGWRRATSAGIGDEEHLARSRQWSAMHLAVPPPASSATALAGRLSAEPMTAPVVASPQSAQLSAGLAQPLSSPPRSPTVASAGLPSQISPIAASLTTAGQAAVAASPAAHLRPMRADADQAQPEGPVTAPQGLPSLDVLRRTLFRDLMTQMRVEFERGA